MIEIVVVRYNNAPPVHPLSAVFDRDGGTVGRSEDNQFVLADPKHHVSRLQARIISDGELHAITNLSHANPTVLNGTELACDVAYPLKAGDEIRIGLYVLRALAATAPVYRLPTATPAPSPNMDLQSQQASATQAAPAAVRLASQAGSAGANAALAASAVERQVAPDAAAPDAQALLQAFLDGAGIPSITLSSGLTPELMELLGNLIGQAVDGTVDLINLRALVKREVNADVTMVVVRNNNPLKFLHDGATVLTQMLRKRMPGFMSPVEAMQDAFDDLHGHQLGMMAGMQAALQDLHRQLDPDTVERNAAAPTLGERLMPAAHKARLWDQYRSLHAKAGNTVQNDQQTLTSKAFLAAYERASERYKDEAANGR